jgi:hypothetical protein
MKLHIIMTPRSLGTRIIHEPARLDWKELIRKYPMAWIQL